MKIKIKGEEIKITWDAVLGALAIFIAFFGTWVIFYA